MLVIIFVSGAGSIAYEHDKLFGCNNFIGLFPFHIPATTFQLVAELLVFWPALSLALSPTVIPNGAVTEEL